MASFYWRARGGQLRGAPAGSTSWHLVASFYCQEHLRGAPGARGVLLVASFYSGQIENLAWSAGLVLGTAISQRRLSMYLNGPTLRQYPVLCEIGDDSVAGY